MQVLLILINQRPGFQQGYMAVVSIKKYFARKFRDQIILSVGYNFKENYFGFRS
jgi:hypothetical protein